MEYKEMKNLKPGDFLKIRHEGKLKFGVVKEIKDVSDAYMYVSFDETKDIFTKIYTGMQFEESYFNSSIVFSGRFEHATPEEYLIHLESAFANWI